MSIKEIGSGIAAVETGAAIPMLTDPFTEGRDVELVVDCDAFNGTVNIETSEDNEDTWDTVLVVTEGGSDRTIRTTVTLTRHMRYDCTSFTSGEADIHIRAGD